jgi:hypothetical protein
MAGNETAGPLPFDFSSDVIAHQNLQNDPAVKAEAITRNNPQMLNSPDAVMALANHQNVTSGQAAAATRYMGITNQMVNAAHATSLSNPNVSSGSGWFSGMIDKIGSAFSHALNEAGQIVDSNNPIESTLGRTVLGPIGVYATPGGRSAAVGLADAGKKLLTGVSTWMNAAGTAGTEGPMGNSQTYQQANNLQTHFVNSLVNPITQFQQMEHAISFYRSIQLRYGTAYATQYFEANLLPALLAKGVLGYGTAEEITAGGSSSLLGNLTEKASELADAVKMKRFNAMREAGRSLTDDQLKEFMEAQMRQNERMTNFAAKQTAAETRAANLAKLSWLRRNTSIAVRAVASPLRIGAKIAHYAFQPGQDATLNMMYGSTAATSWANPETQKLWQLTANGDVYNERGQKIETAGNGFMEMLGMRPGDMAFQVGSDAVEFYSKWLGADPLGATGKLVGQARTAEGFTHGLMSNFFNGMGIKNADDMWRAFQQYGRVQAAVNYMATHDIKDILMTFRNFFDFSTPEAKTLVQKIADSKDPTKIVKILGDMAEGNGLVRNFAPSLSPYNLLKANLSGGVLVGKLLAADLEFIKQFAPEVLKETGYDINPDTLTEAAVNDTGVRSRATFGRWLVKQFTRKSFYFDEITKSWQDLVIIPGSRNAIPAIADNLRALALPEDVVKAAVEALWDATPNDYENAIKSIYYHAASRRALTGLGSGSTESIYNEVDKFLKEVVSERVGADGAGNRGAVMAGTEGLPLGRTVADGTNIVKLSGIGDKHLGSLRMPNPKTIRGLGVTMKRAILNITATDLGDAYALAHANMEALANASEYSDADLKNFSDEIYGRFYYGDIDFKELFPETADELTMEVFTKSKDRLVEHSSEVNDYYIRNYVGDHQWVPTDQVERARQNDFFSTTTINHEANRIKRFGFDEPIRLVHYVKDDALVMDEGSTAKALAAQQLGLTHVPVEIYTEGRETIALDGYESAYGDFPSAKRAPHLTAEDPAKPQDVGLNASDSVATNIGYQAMQDEINRIIKSVPELEKTQIKRNMQFAKLLLNLQKKLDANTVVLNAVEEHANVIEAFMQQQMRSTSVLTDEQFANNIRAIDDQVRSDYNLPSDFQFNIVNDALEKLQGTQRAQLETISALYTKLDTEMIRESELREHISEWFELRREVTKIEKEQSEKMAAVLSKVRDRNPRFLNKWQHGVEISNRLLSGTFVPIALASGGWAIRVSASEALLNSLRQGGWDSFESRVVTSIAKHQSWTKDDIDTFYTSIGQKLEKRDANIATKFLVNLVAHALIGVREIASGAVLGVERSLLNYSDVGTQRMIDNFTSAMIRHDAILPVGVHSQTGDVFSSGWMQRMKIYGRDENGEAVSGTSYRGRDWEHVSAGVGSGIKGYTTALFEHLTRISQDSILQPNMQELSNILKNIGLDILGKDNPEAAAVFQGAKNIRNGANRFYAAGGRVEPMENFDIPELADFRIQVQDSLSKAEDDRKDFINELNNKYGSGLDQTKWSEEERKTWFQLNKNINGHEAMTYALTGDIGSIAFDANGEIQAAMGYNLSSNGDRVRIGYIGSRGLLPGSGDALQVEAARYAQEKDVDAITSSIGYGAQKYHSEHLGRDVSTGSSWTRKQINQIVAFFDGKITQKTSDKTIQELVQAGAESIKTQEQVDKIIQTLEERAFWHIQSMDPELRSRFERDTAELMPMYSTRGRINPLTNKPYADGEIAHRDWAKAIAYNTFNSVSGIGKDGYNIYATLIEQAKNGEVEAPDVLQRYIKKLPPGAEPKNIPARTFVDRDPLGEGVRFDFLNRGSDYIHSKLLGPMVNALSRDPIWLLEYHNAYERLRPLVQNNIITVEQAEVKADIDATINMTKYVHNPKDKSIFEQNMRVAAPFYFAQNQAWRRAMRVLEEDPGAFEKYLKACMGITNVVASASQNGTGVFSIPGTQFMGGVAGFMNPIQSPFARMMFGLSADPTSISSVVPTGDQLGLGMLGNIVRPSWGPIVTIAFKEAKHFLGLDNVPAANKFANAVLGPVTAKQSTLAELAPSSTLRNVINGIQGLSGQDASVMGSAQNQAMNEAMDNKFTFFYDKIYNSIKNAPNVPESKKVKLARTYADVELSKFMANPQNKQQMLLEAKHVALTMYIVKTAIGFFAPVALTLQEKFSQYPEFQKIINEKTANGQSKYTFEQAANIFAEKNPTGILDLVAHTSSNYSPYPETASALSLLTNHPDLVSKYSNASAYLINRNSNFSPAAYQLELELHLRQKEAPQDYYNSLMVALGNDLYYNWFQPEYPDVGTNTASYKNYKELSNIAKNYGNHVNPIWYSQFNGASRHYQEIQAADQMKAMVNDPNVPDSVFGGMEARAIYSAFTTLYFNTVAEYNMATSSKQKSQIMSNWYNQMTEVANKYPNQAYYINGVLRGLPNRQI